MISSSQAAPSWTAAAGVVLVLLAIYVFTSPGRIDIIDGQVRYDVAATWLDTGTPHLRDPHLSRTLFALKTSAGIYGAYNAGASVAAMPLLLVSRWLPGHTAERDRFAFTMTGPVFGAVAGGVLVIAYGMLGLSITSAVGWAIGAALTTLWWPGSVTVFDQNQHGTLLLIAVVLAWASARYERPGLAALAGVVGGALVTYQEIYAVLLPFAALAVIASRDDSPASRDVWRRSVDRGSLVRYLVFGAGATVGVLAFIGFNYLRFSAALAPGRYDGGVLFGSDRLAAFLSLTVSPGKSIVLFSPPILLATAGAISLVRCAPVLGVTIGLVTLIHVLLVMQLTFFGGDWCWGPRYLLVLVPLWGLAAPLAVTSLRRATIVTVLVTGFAVQICAVSMDHQRFFFDHDLRPHFWLDQWAYFKRSQFLERPRELLALILEGIPAEAGTFAPTPQGSATYTPASPRTYDVPGRVWARRFAVFHLPRPWPLWVGWLDRPDRPVDPRPLLATCTALAIAGMVLVARARRSRV